MDESATGTAAGDTAATDTAAAGTDHPAEPGVAITAATANHGQNHGRAPDVPPRPIPPDHYAKVGDSKAATALAGILERAVSGPYRLARKAHLTDILHGTAILKHPLHPALSDLPIGLYIAAIITYAMGFSPAAAALTIAAVVGALGAAATGLADWSVSDGRDKRLGAIHGTFNVVATLFAIASIVTYYTVAAPLALGLVAAALAITFLAAYLGGHLVFDRGLMVNLAAVAPQPEIGWTPVLPESDLRPGQARAVHVSDLRTVIVYKSSAGQISCIEARCGHAGGPLGEGEFSHGTVTCPWHQSVFDLSDGSVHRGPASRPQPVLLARVVAGQIQVRDPGAE